MLLYKWLNLPNLLQKYPNSRISGLSNSSTQKKHIDSTAKARGITNLEVNVQELDFCKISHLILKYLKVITADVNTFDFDRSQKYALLISMSIRPLLIFSLKVRQDFVH